eukprot:gnl/Hemi2/5601_TR1921_c0_g1_i1.p1 gnl/Hemi2/5601_TR1921_c0_g1~~gnl/Hemi2/5601_TR1921_c0_g1_i1.p1  ORF type:complete len:201 (+),score=58.65 gnl/Hemi2/5601_TR1921_c0_g1_i1:144-746(+)
MGIQLPDVMAVIVFVGTYIELAFGLVGLLSAAYFVSELAEEYTSYARFIIKTKIAVVSVLWLLVWFIDGFPVYHVGLGLLAQLLYYLFMPTFPLLKWKSLHFAATVVVFLLNNYFLWTFFSSIRYPLEYSCAFGVLMVWLVPFGLAVSLTTGTGIPLDASQMNPQTKSVGIFRQLFNILSFRNNDGSSTSFSSTQSNKLF